VKGMERTRIQRSLELKYKVETYRKTRNMMVQPGTGRYQEDRKELAGN
jgi:hypothetical protein